MREKILFLVLLLLIPLGVQARQGCCSHHGGVAGCSSSGRQVCNDGTLSPSCTCTPSYTYGCTDSKALNYNASANRADGSCRFSKETTETKVVSYETEYKKDKDLAKGEKKIITKGEDGTKIVTTKAVVDEKGNIISSEIVSEVIEKEPIKAVISEGIKTKSVSKNKSSEEVSMVPLIVMLVINIIYINVVKNTKLLLALIGRFKNDNLFLTCLVRGSLYIAYFILVIPLLFDFIVSIVELIRKMIHKKQ